MNQVTVSQYVEFNKYIQAHIDWVVFTRDETKATHHVFRLMEFIQFALKDPVCRSKFEAANPDAYRVMDINELEEILDIVKDD